MDTAGIETFIARFEERLAPVEKALGEAWWDLSTTGTEEAQKELVYAGTEYNRLFADRDEHALVRGWYEGRGSLESEKYRNALVPEMQKAGITTHARIAAFLANVVQETDRLQTPEKDEERERRSKREVEEDRKRREVQPQTKCWEGSGRRRVDHQCPPRRPG
jgi:hypothetical protein